MFTLFPSGSYCWLPEDSAVFLCLLLFLLGDDALLGDKFYRPVYLVGDKYNLEMGTETSDVDLIGRDSTSFVI